MTETLDQNGFAKKLSRLLADYPGTQASIARELGIAPTAIGDMAKGRRRPYLDQAFKISKILNVPLEYLADDTKTEPQPLKGAFTEEEISIIRLVRHAKLDVDEVFARIMDPAEGHIVDLVVMVDNITSIDTNAPGGMSQIGFFDGRSVKIGGTDPIFLKEALEAYEQDRPRRRKDTMRNLVKSIPVTMHKLSDFFHSGYNPDKDATLHM